MNLRKMKIVMKTVELNVEQSVSDEHTDDEPPSTDGWSKYGRQPDFVKHNFTAANGFKPPYPPPKEVKDFLCYFSPLNSCMN
jgi:hypothetical protein